MHDRKTTGTFLKVPSFVFDSTKSNIQVLIDKLHALFNNNPPLRNEHLMLIFSISETARMMDTCDFLGGWRNTRFQYQSHQTTMFPCCFSYKFVNICKAGVYQRRVSLHMKEMIFREAYSECNSIRKLSTCKEISVHLNGNRFCTTMPCSWEHFSPSSDQSHFISNLHPFQNRVSLCN